MVGKSEPSSPQERSARRARAIRRFAVASAALWAFLLVLWAAFLWKGDAVVRSAVEGQGLAFLRPVLALERGETAAMVLARVSAALRATLIVTAAFHVLAVLVFAALAAGLGKRVAIPLALIGYLAIERWIPPLVTVGLRLESYYLAKDPDHRPRLVDPSQGWNRDSVRSRWNREDFRDEDLSVIFLGDSFTMGYGLGLEQTFPAKVERMLAERFPETTVRVANFAWTSSSPLLSYRRLVDLGAAYRPDLVVLCVDMTDFHDDVKWRQMLDERGFYWLYDKIPLALKALDTLAPGAFAAIHRALNPDLPRERYLVSEHPLEETRPLALNLAANVQRVAECARGLGADFAVFVLPRAYQYSARECPDNWEKKDYTVLGPYALEPFRFFDELRPTVDYPIHSLLEAFRTTRVFPTCFRDDPHWNNAGTGVAARAIARDLEPEVEQLLARRAEPR